jgi:hypothetical protein
MTLSDGIRFCGENKDDTSNMTPENPSNLEKKKESRECHSGK